MTKHWLQLGTVVVVTGLCLSLRQQLRTRRVPGEQWPAPAVLDSLRPFTKPAAAERANIESLGYDELAAYDPFERIALAAEEPLPAPAQPAAAASATPAMALSAILITGDERVAVINNALVRVGSTLPGGARVVAIERDRVEVARSSGTRTVLRLNQGG